MWLRMVLLRGRRFALSITELDASERMVTGERMVDQDMVTVQLTAEQVAEVGLPPGQYWLEGTLLDSEQHRVALPAVEQLRVPTRWLHPLDAARGPTHRDLLPRHRSVLDAVKGSHRAALTEDLVDGPACAFHTKDSAVVVP